MLSNSPPVKNKSLLHFHLGTSETVARIIFYDGINELKAGESCYCQFRLKDPLIAMAGDRYIIRRFSPVETIGGGVILDPSPYRRSLKAGTQDLNIYEYGTLPEKLATKIKRAGIYGIKNLLLEGWIKEEVPKIRESIMSLKDQGIIMQFEDILIHTEIFKTFKDNIINTISDFHKKNPLKPGIFKEELRSHYNIESRLFTNLITAVDEIVIEKETARLKTFKVALTHVDETLKSKVFEVLEKSGFQPPMKEELINSLKIDPRTLTDLLKLMTKEGTLVRINDSMFITSNHYKKMIESLKDFFNKKSEMTVAEFRDTLNTTRKYALPFLEYLDSNKITLRVGDVRKLLIK